MGSRLSGFKNAIYDSKRREFLGRDGARWAKLGIFYFFFYLGMAGFFCTMLAIFMAVTPRDRPRYYSDKSTMRTRSNPLSPGLGFRPQPQVEKNLVRVNRGSKDFANDPFVKNIDQYLRVHYEQNDENNYNSEARKFSINNPGDCTTQRQYGFPRGRPCVLVKMNKIVSFVPVPGYQDKDEEAYQAAQCPEKMNEIPVYCYGEYPGDVDNLGNITYISENGRNNRCGALDVNRFPYQGKVQRQDVYQAPYVWVQFTNPKPNVLINVICRVFADNIDFDRKTARALTRFQIFVTKKSNS